MKKKSKILVTFIQIVLIAVIIFSGIKIIEWIKSNKKNKDIMSEIKENVVINNEMDSNNEEYKIDFAKLKQNFHCGRCFICQAFHKTSQTRLKVLSLSLKVKMLLLIRLSRYINY